MIGCKRCAMLLETNSKGEVINIITFDNPTIGELRSLREKGAIVCYQTRQKIGNQIEIFWVTESGIPITHRTDFLPRRNF